MLSSSKNAQRLKESIEEFNRGGGNIRQLIDYRLDISFLTNAWEDYLYWQRVDKKTLSKINVAYKTMLKNSL